MTNNYTCPVCGGSGELTIDDDTTTYTCRECGGTGQQMVTIPAEEYDRLWEIEEAERWIPVAERLPEEIGRYRCWTKTPLGECEMVEFYRGSGRWNLTNIHTPATVTHWRPLPKGPGEEE